MKAVLYSTVWLFFMRKISYVSHVSSSEYCQSSAKLVVSLLFLCSEGIKVYLFFLTVSLVCLVMSILGWLGVSADLLPSKTFVKFGCIFLCARLFILSIRL